MTKPRVWIELEKPATEAEGQERAKLLSNMLKKLGVDRGVYNPVFWNEGKRCYCFITDEAGSFVEAADHGRWFNLEYLGREA